MFQILIVDDDRNTRKLLGTILSNEGYNVSLATNGLEAIDIIDNNHIDLVVTDIMMPEIDGYQLTKLIRASNENIPILMISAKQLPEDKRRGFTAGTDDYITKPLDEEEFVLRIKALLRRAKIASEKKIVLGDVVIDYDAFTVSRPGEVQRIPQKEFMLLYLLLSYPGRIFTRIQIMDEIWGNNSDSGWETVTVHIGRLRKRFEDWPEIEIESVRGLGYRAVKK